MMTSMAQLALAQAGVSGVEVAEALMLMGVGMLVVFAALLLLLAAIWTLDRVAGEQRPAKPAAAEAPLRTAAASTQTGQLASDDPRLVAVLAAAATAHLQRQVRVTHVRRIEHPQRGGPAPAGRT